MDDLNKGGKAHERRFNIYRLMTREERGMAQLSARLWQFGRSLEAGDVTFGMAGGVLPNDDGIAYYMRIRMRYSVKYTKLVQMKVS